MADFIKLSKVRTSREHMIEYILECKVSQTSKFCVFFLSYPISFSIFVSSVFSGRSYLKLFLLKDTLFVDLHSQCFRLNHSKTVFV